GARDQVLDRARNQHLTRPRRGRDAGRDVDGDAADVVAGDGDLAGVEPGAQLEAERARLLAQRDRAADRARRTVEGGEKAVARVLHLAAAEACERAARRVAVPIKQGAPSAVAEFGGA